MIMRILSYVTVAFVAFVALFFLIQVTASMAQAQTLNQQAATTVPGRYYLACTVSGNDAREEFAQARQAANQLTLRQLQDPWAALRDHITAQALPSGCRFAPTANSGIIPYGLECARSRDGFPVVLREVDMGNGYFLVMIIPEVTYYVGEPEYCRRRR